jgi:hypothetical protein
MTGGCAVGHESEVDDDSGFVCYALRGARGEAVTVIDDKKSLVDQDKALFAAEGHDPEDSWVDVLHNSLSDDFRLRRAIGEIEDRERMITRLSRTDPVKRELLGHEVELLGDAAIVCSRVRVPAGSFANAKLFERTAGGWRCVYWRVTREAER